MQIQAGLRRYLFVDQGELERYLEQFPIEPKKSRKRRWTVSLSIVGPKVEGSEEEAAEMRNQHEKVQLLLHHLDLSGRVAFNRPPSMRDDENRQPFVLETMTAQKMIIPSDCVQRITGLKHLAVWVSDPTPTDPPQDPWDFRGTFLYLTEAHWENGSFQTVWSGCSALQAVVNTLSGQPFFTLGRGEKFGRHSTDHPIEKLKRLGGVVTDTRRIISLYFKRYLTNEQCYRLDGRDRRVNDLLGYPIFIAEPL
jgi:hypothetical protein